MKTFDVILLVLACVLAFAAVSYFEIPGIISFLFGLIVLAFAIAFVLYWKFAQYKTAMDTSYQNAIDKAEKVFAPILRTLEGMCGKVTLGPKHVTSRAPIVFVVLLMIILFLV